MHRFCGQPLKGVLIVASLQYRHPGVAPALDTTESNKVVHRNDHAE